MIHPPSNSLGLPSSTSSPVTPQTAVKPPVTQLARRVLGATDQPPTVSLPAQSWSLGVGSWVATISRFFERHFARITEAAQQQAAEIQNSISGMDAVLQSAHEAVRQAQRRELKLTGQPPTAETVKQGEDSLKTLKNSLDHARSLYQGLSAQLSDAKTLAEKYAAYEKLPEQIAQLGAAVADLERRVGITEKLLNLEAALHNYAGNAAWDAFAAIQKQGVVLAETLKNAVAEKSAAGRENWQKLSFNEARSMIRGIYADLEKQTQRVLDHYARVADQRITDLSNQVKNLEGAIQRYAQKESNIAQMERYLSDSSWNGKVYRYLFGKERLQQQLQAAHGEKAALSAAIAQSSAVLPAEEEWLKKVDAGLFHKIEAARQLGQTLIWRQKLSGHLEQCADILAAYRQVQSLNEASVNEILKRKLAQELGSLSAVLGIQGTAGDPLSQIEGALSSVAALQFKGARLLATITALEWRAELIALMSEVGAPGFPSAEPAKPGIPAELRHSAPPPPVPVDAPPPPLAAPPPAPSPFILPPAPSPAALSATVTALPPKSSRLNALASPKPETAAATKEAGVGREALLAAIQSGKPLNKVGQPADRTLSFGELVQGLLKKEQVTDPELEQLIAGLKEHKEELSGEDRRSLESKFTMLQTVAWNLAGRRDAIADTEEQEENNGDWD